MSKHLLLRRQPSCRSGCWYAVLLLLACADRGGPVLLALCSGSGAPCDLATAGMLHASPYMCRDLLLQELAAMKQIPR